MDERFEVSVYFWTEGFGTATEVTEQMGLVPTVSWNKGDPDPRPYLPDFKNQCSYWELSIPAPPEEISIDAHFAALLDLLEPRKRTVIELAKKFEAGITCICYFPDTCPCFSLSTSILRRCGDLYLALHFELFCIDDDEAFMRLVNRHLDLAACGNFDPSHDEEPIPF